MSATAVKRSDAAPKMDVLADQDAHFRRGNFCSVIRGSRWRG